MIALGLAIVFDEDTFEAAQPAATKMKEIEALFGHFHRNHTLRNPNGLEFRPNWEETNEHS